VNSAYHRRVAFPSDLADSTSRQLQSTSPRVVHPSRLGRTHGPHLPLDTDTRIGHRLSLASVLRGSPTGMNPIGPWRPRSARREWRARRLSPAPSRSGRRRCGFCWWSSDVRIAMASRLVFVNGHGGNVEAACGRAGFARYEGRDVGWCSCTVAECRRTRRPHRNVCIATYFADRRVGRRAPPRQ